MSNVRLIGVVLTVLSYLLEISEMFFSAVT